LAKGSSPKKLFRQQVLELLTRIALASEAEALRTLQTERLIAAFEKMSEACYLAANAANISNRVEPVSEWNPFKDALWRIGVKPEGN
jgi:hypothetical protein